MIIYVYTYYYDKLIKKLATKFKYKIKYMYIIPYFSVNTLFIIVYATVTVYKQYHFLKIGL